ncbi:hypothetical protein JCM4914_01280 [Streptomyces platensis subsp. malvinus]
MIRSWQSTTAARHPTGPTGTSRWGLKVTIAHEAITDRARLDPLLGATLPGEEFQLSRLTRYRALTTGGSHVGCRDGSPVGEQCELAEPVMRLPSGAARVLLAAGGGW